MSFKVLRDGGGVVVAFGPDLDAYEPGIPAGCALGVEQDMPAASLAQNIAALVSKIKADANRIVGDTVGNLSNEYTQARDDAKAFKSAAYIGAVPSSVSSWATAKSWTATAACDDILAAAANWAGAQAAIRSNRLARTEAAKACTTQAALDTVAAQWAGFVSAIRNSLGV